MYKFDFNKTEYEYFIDQCPFTDEELKVFEMRRRGKSVCSMSYELNISERTVKRRVASVYRKIMKLL